MAKLCWVALGCLLALGNAAAQSKAVTNEDIAGMAKLGLGDTVILAKIKSSPSAFDTGAEALVRLKQAGVSDAVLSAMVEADGQSEAMQNQAAEELAAISLVADGSRTPLTASPVQFESSSRKDWIPVGNFKAEYFIFVGGRHADNKTSDVRPVFLSKVPPSKVRLVWLGQHKRREDRFVVFSGNRSDREIPLESQQKGNVFEFRPARDLAVGEYAFLVTADLPTEGIGGLMRLAGSMAPMISEAYDFDVAQ